MSVTTKLYPSKKGFVIYIPLMILLGVEVIYIASGMYVGAVICLVIMLAVFFPIFFNTYYTITDEGVLRVKCGLLFNLKVPVLAIRKLENTRTVLSSPALSLDRIEIFYNKFDSVIVSPENKTDFVAQLQAINPGIEYQNKPNG